MRNHFDDQLEQLGEELTAMGHLCETAISMAVSAFLNSNDEVRRSVYETDSEIDRKEREIEALCLKLLLRQQPVARDLRLISSAMKMISDMERIGDQASDIAEITEYVGKSKTKSHTHISDMSAEAVEMVKLSVKAFVTKDTELAKTVIARDDRVDELFTKVKSELVDRISAGGDGEEFLDLLMIAKYLERIGDHATGIAEWVIFSIVGAHVDAEETALHNVE